jgi:hypothetical protein
MNLIQGNTVATVVHFTVAVNLNPQIPVGRLKIAEVHGIVAL